MTISSNDPAAREAVDTLAEQRIRGTMAIQSFFEQKEIKKYSTPMIILLINEDRYVSTQFSQALAIPEDSEEMQRIRTEVESMYNAVTERYGVGSPQAKDAALTLACKFITRDKSFEASGPDGFRVDYGMDANVALCLLSRFGMTTDNIMTGKRCLLMNNNEGSWAVSETPFSPTGDGLALIGTAGRDHEEMCRAAVPLSKGAVYAVSVYRPAKEPGVKPAGILLWCKMDEAIADESPEWKTLAATQDGRCLEERHRFILGILSKLFGPKLAEVPDGTLQVTEAPKTIGRLLSVMGYAYRDIFPRNCVSVPFGADGQPSPMMGAFSVGANAAQRDFGNA